MRPGESGWRGGEGGKRGGERGRGLSTSFCTMVKERLTEYEKNASANNTGPKLNKRPPSCQ